MNKTKYNNLIKAVLVGVSDYTNISNAENLPFCMNDIRIISSALMAGLKVNPAQIKVMGIPSGYVTKEEFVEGLKVFFQNIQESDTLIFYYTGHGTNISGKHYFVMSNGLVETQLLIELFQELPAKNKILFLDTCMSGNYEMKKATAMIDEHTWLSEFLEKGCVVFSSSNAEQFSRSLPNSQISLFSYYLAEALINHYTINEGKKSLESIRDLVYRRISVWNKEHPESLQNPVYRSNTGGAIMFPVEESRPFIQSDYYSDHEDYTIFRVEPMHSGIAKRYAVKVILKHAVSRMELSKLNHEIVQEALDLEIFKNEIQDVRWRGKKANIVFSYFGYDEFDVVNGNYEYITVWVDTTQNKEQWYQTSSTSISLFN